MNRILIPLALFALLLMGAALVLGLSVGNLYDSPGEQDLRMATVHRLTGMAAALAVVFVESIIVTYFIGTSRWCKEVVETYDLERDAILASALIKRRAFPWAVMGMLVVVGVSALGAASDPATGRANTASWTNIHLLAAFVGWGFIGWTFYSAWNRIQENQQVIQKLVDRVAEVRKEKNLDRE